MNSEWGNQLEQAAITDYRGNTKNNIQFDRRLVLMIVAPIRYSQLRSSDITNVSTLCLFFYIDISFC